MTKQEWILMTAMRQSFDDTAHIEDCADLLEQKGYFGSTPSGSQIKVMMCDECGRGGIAIDHASFLYENFRRKYLKRQDSNA